MKKYISLLVPMLLAVMLFATVSVASEVSSETGDTEVCSLADGKKDCEVWWFYNAKEHWRACVEHRDSFGNDTLVSDPESHTFEEGVCTVCGTKETSGIGGMSYLFVIIIVAGIGMMISFRYKRNTMEATTFGLDKFRKL